jgi:hypothetical protein
VQRGAWAVEGSLAYGYPVWKVDIIVNLLISFNNLTFWSKKVKYDEYEWSSSILLRFEADPLCSLTCGTRENASVPGGASARLRGGPDRRTASEKPLLSARGGKIFALGGSQNEWR